MLNSSFEGLCLLRLFRLSRCRTWITLATLRTGSQILACDLTSTVSCISFSACFRVASCITKYTTEPLITQWYHIIPHELSDGSGLTLNMGRSSKWEYFHGPQRLERQVVQRLLATALWPCPVTPHWVACQRNLCQTRERACLTPWLKTDVSATKTVVKLTAMRGHADRRRAPPSAPVKTESGAIAAAGRQHSLNSTEAAVRKEASRSGEDGRASLQTVRCLQGRFSWAQILASSQA